jgi:hypothetical protein
MHYCSKVLFEIQHKLCFVVDSNGLKFLRYTPYIHVTHTNSSFCRLRTFYVFFHFKRINFKHEIHNCSSGYVVAVGASRYVGQLNDTRQLAPVPVQSIMSQTQVRNMFRRK